MRAAAVAVCSAVAMVLTMSSGLAQTQPMQPPPPLVPGGAESAEPVSPVPGAEFQIGPRFWYSFFTSGATKSTTPTLLSTNAGDAFPMAGLVGSARFSSLPDTTFVLSALYGKARVANSTITVINPSDITATQQSLHANREDFEALGQTAIPNSNWAWIGGVRWEHVAQNLHNTITAFPTPSSNNQRPCVNVSCNVSASANIATLKGGIAGAVPLNAAGDLSLFGNIMLMAGAAVHSLSANTGIVGPDLSIGLQYTPTPAISIDVRYRALIEFIVAQPANSSSNYSVNQGPMISANFKF
jgi:hypothetical protein